ncbi:MAG: MDR family oxidoreductase [Acidimicrobiales bacterium]
MAPIRAVLAAEPATEPASTESDAKEPDRTRGRLGEIDSADLPAGDVTIRVQWSSLNYKDGLAVTGKGRVVRSFPMVCGVDLAGVVLQSEALGIEPGQEVIVTGWGLGEERHGGYADIARVRSEWVVRMPAGLDPRSSMAIGTAGLTSMLCVLALEGHGLTPAGAAGMPVVVTGAAGGVGSVAIALLAHLGYEVTAVSGRSGEAEQEAYLRALGATGVIPRAELADAKPRALDTERWAAGIDAVGGPILATILRQTRYGGCVAACGLAGGADLPTTVHPFILRGIDLAGVESVRCPTHLRVEAWHRLASDLPRDVLESMTVEARLEDVPSLAEEILGGRTRGRVVIAVNP